MISPVTAKWVVVLYSTLGYPHMAWVGEYQTKEECLQAGDKLWTGMWTCLDTKPPRPERLGDGDFRQ